MAIYRGTGATGSGEPISLVDADNAAITGGTIDGTVIGGTTPAAGTFTTVTGASGIFTTIDINGGTIDGVTLTTSDITVGAGKTLDVSAGTLTLADNQISGNKVDGGTISNFASTGIDDNADAVAITIDSNENVGIGISTIPATYDPRVVIDANSGDGTQGLLIRSYKPSVTWEDKSGAAANYRWTADANVFWVDIDTDSDGTFDVIRAFSINSAGNVGVGNSSLESWTSGYKALQLGATGNFSTDNGNYLNISENAYQNSGWKYQNTDAASLYQSFGGQHVFYVAGSGTADTAISWTAALAINNSGNVGIGNSSLENWGSAYDVLQLHNTSALFANADQVFVSENAYHDGVSWKFISTSPASVYVGYNGQHEFRTTASGTADSVVTWTTAMRINADGNVGIGNSSLESWHSTYTALQIGGNGGLWADTAEGADKSIQVSQNQFYDGSHKYISTGEASNYYQAYGTHVFRVAPSGTAGTAISWTTALTINNAGNVGVTSGSIASWSSFYNALQIGSHASLATDVNSLYVGTNFYSDGSWKRIASGYVARVQADKATGNLKLATATTGAAGSAISWNTGLTINNSGKAIFITPTTSTATVNLPHGTAPSSPVDGDMWTTTAGLYVRINGTTVGPLS